jgi:hypothetical protein
MLFGNSALVSSKEIVVSRQRCQARSIGFTPLLWLALVLIQASPSHAETVLIDFEMLPDGTMPIEFSPVEDAYESLGVVFGTLEADDRTLPSFRFFIAPGGWVGDYGRALEPDVGFHVLATFERPVTSVSFDTWTAAPTGFTVIANALDAAGNSIGSVESDPVRGHLKGRYTLEGVGPISAVWWVSNQPFLASVAIRDLEFEFAVEPVAVDIDIRPRSGRNVIPPSPNAIVRVALLGSEELDVTSVDESSLVLGPSGLGFALEGRGRFVDVDKDGHVDLVSSHLIGETGIVVGDVEACLTGELLDGTPLEGCDGVFVLPQSPRKSR